MITNAVIQAFNRGLISPLALARTDIERIALSAEIQTNWMPRVLGSMMLRPGLGYTGTTRSNLVARTLPFIFSARDTARLELTDTILRVWVGDTLISRPTVSAAVTNGGFDTDLSGWTDADETGATSSWVAFFVGGLMGLLGTSFKAAIRKQTVTVSNPNIEHALRIRIARGPVLIRVGSANEGDDYVSETTLATGEHSLSFTPSGNFYIKLFSREPYQVLVDSITVESAGTMQLTAPWLAADLPLIRYDQSGDVVFVACPSYAQRRIERRSTRSWSIVNYEATDGPFLIENVTPITLSPSGVSGNITLTASDSYFKPSNVGSLFSLSSVGQRVDSLLAGDNQYTDPIQVTGIEGGRRFNGNLSGVWTGTLTLQRSIGAPGAWSDVDTYTGNGDFTLLDGLDNLIVYYRIGFKGGDYGSGTVDAVMTFAGGSIVGVVRVTSYTSPTLVNAMVLKSLGGTSATPTWSEGAWSPRRGYPSAVTFYEGRLWWAGKDKIWGSVSDAFASFDPATVGDAGPISRSIGSGPVDSINWLMPLQRLFAGTDSAEKSVRSSSFDEPLTPTNFNIKDTSTQGSAQVAAVKADDVGLFVQNSGVRLYGIKYDTSTYNPDYSSTDYTALIPEVGYPGITLIAVQRQPDTRIHCVRSDGTVAVLVNDSTEKVMCWVEVVTDGYIEDVVVLPGLIESTVYYTVRRTINGSTVRYHEKWALESECQGGTLCKLADSFTAYDGAPATAITGLSHLEGESVVVWADGLDVGLHTVSSGQITLAVAASQVVAGLYYEAPYKSTKLAYAASAGTALTQRKIVKAVGLILQSTHAQGLQYGPDFDHLDDLPSEERGEFIDPDFIWDRYDNDSFTFNGEYDNDSRICLKAAAPRPCTVLAAVLTVQTFDKI